MIDNILKELDLTEDQLSELKAAAGKGPMEIMAAVQKAGIKPEVFQKIMGMVMANPNLLNGLTQKFGVSQDVVDQAKDSLKDPKS